MGKSYNNPLFKGLTFLQGELKANRISNGEFRALLGFLLNQQMSALIDEEMKDMIPKQDGSFFQTTLLSYQRDKNLTHASN